MSRIVISGGGTGGHIYPAIGIAKELIQLDAETRGCLHRWRRPPRIDAGSTAWISVPANLRCRFSAQINMAVDTCCVQGLFRLREIILVAQKPKT